MKNKLLRFIFGATLLIFIMQSCQQDEPLEKPVEKTETSKFGVFEKRKMKGVAARESNTFYQEGFRYLYFRYFELHPEEAPDFNDPEIPKVDFRFASQVFQEEDESVSVLYPIVENGKVVELLAANITSDHTYVSFFFIKDSENKSAVISAFARRVDDPDTRGGFGELIEEVIITYPLSPLNSQWPFLMLPLVGVPGGGGCSYYGDCGGGGSSGETPPIVIPQPQPTPCDKIKKVGKNQKTKDLMNDLKTKTGDNKEHGQVLVEDNNTITPFPVMGNPGEDWIDLNITGQVDGFIHSHFIGQLSVFSLGDIFGLAQMHVNGNIYDVNTFVVGVVTGSGTTATQYLMVIDNPAQFANFANSIMSGNQTNSIAFNAFEHAFKDVFYINPSNNGAINEANFVKLLDKMNTGLKMLKGSTDLNNWSVLNQNSSGAVAPQNCL